MTVRADFVVIGAGIAGASAAYELSRRGSVILIEQEHSAGYHTTGRSAALYTEAYESGPVRRLVLASRGHLAAPPAGFADEPLLSPLPVLFIAREDQVDSLDAIEDDAKGNAAGTVAVRRLTSDEAIIACSALRPDYVAAGLLETESMSIDVHALHQGFLRGARRRGAEIILAAPAVEIDPSHHGITVRHPGGEIQAGVAVNAAGAWADAVAELAGALPKGLQPYRRTALTFAAPAGTNPSDWPMVVDADEDFYFKPEPGRRFMGSLAEETPMEPHDVRPEEIDVALAVERINTATTLGVRHVTGTWAGLRTFAADRRPVVGFDPDVSRMFWLAGQGGYGIMTSPAMARLAASLITGNGVPEDLAAAGFEYAAVDPGRFAK